MARSNDVKQAKDNLYIQSNQTLYTNKYTWGAKKSHPPSNKSSSADCTVVTRESINFPRFKFSAAPYKGWFFDLAFLAGS